MRYLNHVFNYEPGHQVFFVGKDGHEQLVYELAKLGWAPMPCEGAPFTDDDDKTIAGVWYCSNVDDDGFEWHFVNRDNEAMQFKLTY